jgi:formiminotetrahydrofolate cyclodeaminase
MSEMGANFTAKSRRYASVHRTIREMLEELESLRAKMLELVEEDIKAYNSVNEALRMPRSSESQRAARKQALDSAFRTAIKPPHRVMQGASRLAALAVKLVDIGNPNLITDVGISAVLADATCTGARLNVEVNLRYLGDKALARKLAPELDSLCKGTAQARDRVMRKVNKRLKKLKK